jgi:hypothetical protein
MEELRRDRFDGNGDRVFAERRAFGDRRSYGARTFREAEAFARDRTFGDDRSLGDERSLGALFSQLTQDVSLLMRQEMALAKAELAEKAVRARKNAVAVGAGGFVAYLGALALMAAVILFLTQVIGIVAWLSALLIGLIAAGVGYAMLNRGIQDMGAIDPKPQRTVETVRSTVQRVRNDIQLVKEQRS